MNKTMILTDDNLSNIHSVMDTVLALDGTKQHVVHIKLKNDSYSDKQRKLYWRWLTEIGNEFGDSKDYYHEMYKEKFLMSMFERDSSDFRKMIDSIREIYRTGDEANAMFLRKQVLKMVSIRDSSVGQFAEYLTNIKNDVGIMGLALSSPDNRNLLEYREMKNENPMWDDNYGDS